MTENETKDLVFCYLISNVAEYAEEVDDYS